MGTSHSGLVFRSVDSDGNLWPGRCIAWTQEYKSGFGLKCKEMWRWRYGTFVLGAESRKASFFYGFLTKTKKYVFSSAPKLLVLHKFFFFFKQSHKAEINEATAGLSRMCVCTKLPKCPYERRCWCGSRATLSLPSSPSSASCPYLKILKNAEQTLKHKVTCLGSCALSHGIGALIAVDSTWRR